MIRWERQTLPLENFKGLKMDLLTSPEDREIFNAETYDSLATTKPTAEKATAHKGGNPMDPSPYGATRTREGCKLLRGALKASAQA